MPTEPVVQESLERLRNIAITAEACHEDVKLTISNKAQTAADIRAIDAWQSKLAGEVERLTVWGNERHAAAREAMDTAYHLKYPPSPELLESIAERIDCGGNCETAWREWDTNATGCTKSETEGCPFEEAANLRDFAKALRAQALASLDSTVPAGEVKPASAQAPMPVALPMPEYRYQQEDLSGGSALAAASPEDRDARRERYARIIDAEAFLADPDMQPSADTRQAVVQRRNHARAKADAILALKDEGAGG